MGGLLESSPKQIPGLGFWTALPSYIPAIPAELGPLKVFPFPTFQSGATAVIKKEHHVF